MLLPFKSSLTKLYNEATNELDCRDSKLYLFVKLLNDRLLSTQIDYLLVLIVPHQAKESIFRATSDHKAYTSNNKKKTLKTSVPTGRASTSQRHERASMALTTQEPQTNTNTTLNTYCVEQIKLYPPRSHHALFINYTKKSRSFDYYTSHTLHKSLKSDTLHRNRLYTNKPPP